jgi:antitoxin (DNA-binding transcriptional repressor) of toxin-antitoxin stability system
VSTKVKVELSFDRFHLLPGDRHFERIRVERVDHRKHGLEHGRVVARVVGLRAEDNERLAIDDQGMAAGTAFDPRQVRRRRTRGQSCRDERKRQPGEKCRPHERVLASSPVNEKGPTI